MAAPIGNKFAENNSGKPKKFKTPEEMQVAIDSYFKECGERVTLVYDGKKKTVVEVPNPIPYTVEGLCNVLDITRQTLLNYENNSEYEEYFDIVKKAKAKIQQNLVERGLEGSANPAVAIFIMKNNYGYTDRQEISSDINTRFTVEITNADTPPLADDENDIQD